MKPINQRRFQMRLSEGQRHYLEALSRILSLETLLKIMDGNIKEFEDLQLNLVNPESAEENTELYQILEKEIAERRKRLNKALQMNC
jgi:hypothetical protein